MPAFPKDWLGWLTLLGALSGLIAASKLFLSGLWFNPFQARILIAVEQSVTKQILIIRRYGGGIVFCVTPKPNDKPNDYHKYFSDGGGEESDSHANLVFLEELSNHGYFKFNKEELELGTKKLSEETYNLTAKGLRTARLFKVMRSLFRHPSQ